jgi:hypothetical protein
MNTAGHLTRIGCLAQVEAQRWRLPREIRAFRHDKFGTFATVDQGWRTASIPRRHLCKGCVRGVASLRSTLWLLTRDMVAGATGG